MKPTQIIQNAVLSPDGTILISEKPDDVKFYTDDRDNDCSIWGGTTVFHYSGRSPYPGHGCEDLSLTTGSLDDEVMERLLWGTLGRDGWKQRPMPPYQWVRIKDMTVGHLINCMAGGWVRPGQLHYAVMARTLLARILSSNFEVHQVFSDRRLFGELFFDEDLAFDRVAELQEEGARLVAMTSQGIKA